MKQILLLIGTLLIILAALATGSIVSQLSDYRNDVTVSQIELYSDLQQHKQLLQAHFIPLIETDPWINPEILVDLKKQLYLRDVAMKQDDIPALYKAHQQVVTDIKVLMSSCIYMTHMDAVVTKIYSYNSHVAISMQNYTDSVQLYNQYQSNFPNFIVAWYFDFLPAKPLH